MAFFRKTKKSTETPEDRQAKTEALQNQAKWDELERMVSDPSDPSVSPSSGSAETNFVTSEPSMTASAPSLNIDPQDLRDVDAAAFTSDLKVDMPADSKFVDSMVTVVGDSFTTDEVSV